MPSPTSLLKFEDFRSSRQKNWNAVVGVPVEPVGLFQEKGLVCVCSKGLPDALS